MFKVVTLSLFLIIMFLTSWASADPSRSNDPSTSWQYESSTDAIDDHTRTVSFMHNESNNVAGKSVYLMVEIGCGSQGAFVGFTYSERTKEVTYRIDKNPPVNVDKFFNFDDVHMSVIVGSQGLNLINGILAGNELIIRRKNLSALTKSDHKIDISSQKENINRAISTCY